MVIGRILLTLLVALSVAAMPLGGASVLAANSAKISASEISASEVSAPDAEHDCCPDGKAGNTAMDCGSLPGCAVKCFGGLGFAISPMIVPETFALGGSLPVYDAVRGHTYGPPLRPPRI